MRRVPRQLLPEVLVPGALVGGYLLALAESLCGTYVSATYQDLVAFVVLAMVFTFKPTGLFKEAA